MGEEDKNGANEKDRRIRELEEKIKRLKQEKGEVPEGTAASILKGLGGIIPGLDGLLKGLEKSEAFGERLQAIDSEIEARLRSEPLKRTERGVPPFQARGSRRTGPRIVPPNKRQATPRAKREAVPSREPTVDVFEEETYLRILAELPGVEERDIKVNLNGAQLILSTDTPTHKYYKETTLPYAPRGQMEKSYRNGILELMLQKE